jgi:hypothetical protein
MFERNQGMVSFDPNGVRKKLALPHNHRERNHSDYHKAHSNSEG